MRGGTSRLSESWREEIPESLLAFLTLETFLIGCEELRNIRTCWQGPVRQLGPGPGPNWTRRSVFFSQGLKTLLDSWDVIVFSETAFPNLLRAPRPRDDL